MVTASSTHSIPAAIGFWLGGILVAVIAWRHRKTWGCGSLLLGMFIAFPLLSVGFIVGVPSKDGAMSTTSSSPATSSTGTIARVPHGPGHLSQRQMAAAALAAFAAGPGGGPNEPMIVACAQDQSNSEQMVCAFTLVDPNSGSTVRANATFDYKNGHWVWR